MNRVRELWDKCCRQLTDHPFLLSVLFVLAIAIPGYIRLEILANDAHEAAREVRELVVAERIEEEKEQMLFCQIENNSRESFRRTFNSFIDTLQAVVEEGSGVTPETTAVFARLRLSIPMPANTDADCNGDGIITEEDYAHFDNLTRPTG